MRIKLYLDTNNLTAGALAGRVRFAIRRLLPQRRPVYIKPEDAVRKKAVPTL